MPHTPTTLGQHLRIKRAARKPEATQPKPATNREHQAAIRRAQAATRRAIGCAEAAMF